MIKIAIIIGSTRPGRKAEAVARWVHGIAAKRTDAAYSLVDIQDFNLPLLDEPAPASRNQYSKDHTKRWAAEIAQYDGFVFVTAGVQPRDERRVEECDRLPLRRMEQQGGGLRRATAAWAARGPSRTCASSWARSRSPTSARPCTYPFSPTSRTSRTFKPQAMHERTVNAMLDEVVAWSGALQSVRAAKEVRSAA
jgi:hypothetical protein